MKIKHVWFDFGETIVRTNEEAHDELRYESYSKVTGKPVTEKLKQEYEKLFEAHNHSNSDVFYSLGKPSGWWAGQIDTLDPSKLFELCEKDIPNILKSIAEMVPISIFSNVNMESALPALHIDINWFAHVLSSKSVGKPKPALDGFRKIIELSELDPPEILYVGDSVKKDIVPAKQVGLRTGLVWSDSGEAEFNFDSFHEIQSLIEKQL